MIVRPAIPTDAPAIAAVLAEILSRWGSDRPSDAPHVLAHYVEHPASVVCAVALEADRLLGFQSLKRAWPGNPYGVTPGWGIIGSYVSGRSTGRGVGRALFAMTRAEAERAGLRVIDATIGATNPEGLGYYEAMGFRSYRSRPGAICKRYDLA